MPYLRRHMKNMLWMLVILVISVGSLLGYLNMIDNLQNEWNDTSFAEIHSERILVEDDKVATTTELFDTDTDSVYTCSASQLAIIEKQLPREECLQFRDKPFKRGGLCSFSYATRCPEAKWLHDYYTETKATGHRQAIYVGCNKAMDAVNTMRMLSMNASYDKDLWRDAFFNGKPVGDGGNCNQAFDANFDIPSNMPEANVDVYCVEAMPGTAKELFRTTDAMDYKSSLHVVNAAMSYADGTALFPNANVGTEGQGMADCNARDGKKAAHCTEVPMYKLDTYVKEHVVTKNSSAIDFLSIDVEGYDGAVLAGAGDSLANVLYLEFEYNWKGAWKQQTLSGVLRDLHAKDFVCYWAGTAGNLWRLTDCWLDYFDIHVWSNVACVKKSHTDLLRRMEAYFAATLAAGDAIRYDNQTAARTDGRITAIA
ncbi:hypothetical protein MPSEU_000027600 [Mayamaea pseudoterrestris]|nr:hypothetical protein MPSEU_000027600 [Mayamaea pseudoterrestris]